MSAVLCPWALVVPVKGGPSAKSRLGYAARPALASALALDTIDAARRATHVGLVLVVTPDDVMREGVRALEADTGGATGLASLHVVEDPGAGLDAAAAHGFSQAVALGWGRAAVLLADHPALTPAELDRALEAAARHTRSFVPDAAGTGTALAAFTDPAVARTSFGAGSAARHESAGLVRLAVDLPGLAVDVDDLEDLERALAIGVGPRTAGVLRASL